MASVNYHSVLRKRVFISGCNGNLGQKFAEHLLQTKKYDLFLTDVHPESSIKHDKMTPRVDYIPADLTVQSGTWMRRLRRTDYVVHFAADNSASYPDSTWNQASNSMDISFNLLIQAAKARVQRIVIASSNHVLGGWKESGGVSLKEDGSNSLTPDSGLAVGTLWVGGNTMLDSTAYAVPKFASERLAHSLSKAYPSTSFIVVRLGWCQPGPNKASTLTFRRVAMPSETSPEAGGSMLAKPGRGSTLDDPVLLDKWFQSMWLSNRDFCSLFSCCLEIKLPSSCEGFAIVNGMSANSGSRWELKETRELLGYQPQDDSSEAVDSNRA